MNTVVLAPSRAPQLEPIEGLLEPAPADRLLLLAPHPDDESLAAGGLLQQANRAGAGLRVVYATDGENNPWAQLVHEGRWPWSPDDRRRWGARRRLEAVDAIRQLGIDPSAAHFLGFPDQGLTEDMVRGDERLLRSITAELRTTQPTLLAIPSLNDRHPDHSAIAALVRVALHRAALREPPRVLQYMVHPPEQCERRSSWVMLDDAEQELKRQAILCHRTQLRWRRSALLATARETEDFVAVYPPRRLDPLHPIARAWFEGRDLVFEMAKPPRLALGPTELHVMIETGAGALVTAALPLSSRRETAARLGGGSGRAACGEVRLSWDAARGRGRLVFTALLRPRQAFLKLERRLEHRFGIFDDAGWRAVPVGGEETEGLEDDGAGS